MFLAATNFSLFYYAATKRYREIIKNSEFRAYCVLVAAASIILALIILPGKETPLNAFRHALFQVLAIPTTTGFSSDVFGAWVPAAQMILFFLMFIGGCSGSTSGCIKIIRWVILGKQAKREYLRMLHPHGVFTIRINGRPIKGQVVFASAAFITLYLAIVFVSTLITTIVDGVDVITSFTASLSLIGNIGPGLGHAGPAYTLSFFSPAIKLMYCFVMLIGRLEVYAILLFFFPSFWKKEA
jgi:trk system potassium uptake protein TrkH